MFINANIDNHFSFDFSSMELCRPGGQVDRAQPANQKAIFYQRIEIKLKYIWFQVTEKLRSQEVLLYEGCYGENDP